MIVTADDLDAAMRYPTSLLHIVFRAFFGCGVVCGLGLRPKQSGGWVLCVDRGVAIDCQGHPIELCAPVELDLSPEACACEPPPDEGPHRRAAHHLRRGPARRLHVRPRRAAVRLPTGP